MDEGSRNWKPQKPQKPSLLVASRTGGTPLVARPADPSDGTAAYWLGRHEGLRRRTTRHDSGGVRTSGTRYDSVALSPHAGDALPQVGHPSQSSNYL